ncbi:hypothetical protein ABID56_001254 [Alkalibacillus flavidus]|uniref:DUF4181 domain-containing protein n=1 Tax=Alkalibacillus flavidus TaxID=546021 RepID=A0ABV2KUB7_9BACI
MLMFYIILFIMTFVLLTEFVKWSVRRALNVQNIKRKPFSFEPYKINDLHYKIKTWMRIGYAFCLFFILPATMAMAQDSLLHIWLVFIIGISLAGPLRDAHFEYWHSDTPMRAFVTLSEGGMILLAGIFIFVFNVPEIVMSV